MSPGLDAEVVAQKIQGPLRRPVVCGVGWFVTSPPVGLEGLHHDRGVEVCQSPEICL
jgi:hypothetical protein